MKGKSEVEKGVLSASGEKESGRERMGEKKEKDRKTHTPASWPVYTRKFRCWDERGA